MVSRVQNTKKIRVMLSAQIVIFKLSEDFVHESVLFLCVSTIVLHHDYAHHTTSKQTRNALARVKTVEILCHTLSTARFHSIGSLLIFGKKKSNNPPINFKDDCEIQTVIRSVRNQLFRCRHETSALLTCVS